MITMPLFWAVFACLVVMCLLAAAYFLGVSHGETRAYDLGYEQGNNRYENLQARRALDRSPVQRQKYYQGKLRP